MIADRKKLTGIVYHYKTGRQAQIVNYHGIKSVRIKYIDDGKAYTINKSAIRKRYEDTLPGRFAIGTCTPTHLSKCGICGKIKNKKANLCGECTRKARAKRSEKNQCACGRPKNIKSASCVACYKEQKKYITDDSNSAFNLKPSATEEEERIATEEIYRIAEQLRLARPSDHCRVLTDEEYANQKLQRGYNNTYWTINTDRYRKSLHKSV